MKIINVTEAPILDNPLGLNARIAADSEEIQIVHFTLQPEEVILPHALPMRVFFIVLEGEGEISIDNKKEIVSENCLIESPPNVERGWKAVGNKQLRVVAIKAMKSVK